MGQSAVGRAARPLARVSIALFTAAVLSLSQSILWSDAIPFPIAIMTVAVAVLAYARPAHALLAVAGLAPLGPTLGGVLGVGMREAEALVLGFLAGALVRGWTLHRFREFPSTRLEGAVLLFGAIVAVSCGTQLAQSDTHQLMAYASSHYLTSFRGFGAIFNAMLLLEGVALLLYAVESVRTSPGFPFRLLRMIVIGALGAVAVNVWFFAHELLETGDPLGMAAQFFLHQRWSAHVGDVNAAASYFAMVMFIAFGMAAASTRARAWWVAAGAAAGVALWMTASRTAFVAAFIVAIGCIVWLTLRRTAPARRIVLASIAVLIPIAVLAGQYFSLARTASGTAGRAVNIRWLFLQTTTRMIEAHPWMGVGIGQYARASARFSPPELLAIYPRENAHNNFAQIAGELGLIGLAAFLCLLVIALWRQTTRGPLAMAALAGVAAFVLTWLGGHPLLVPEVSYPFWMTLAVAAAESPNLAKAHA